MRKNMFLKLVCAAVALASVTVMASAKGFTKTQEYKDGQFTDVPAKQWYAAEVKSAYELGFMNGKSDTAFDPDGNVTVAEGITMASRVHANYNGKTIAEKTGGKWYDMYIAYAVENGLIKEGQFANFDRNIMRYEMAVMFANAMPADYFTAKNDIKDIPDVASTEEYYDALMMLYKAGVVLGSDDYGNFYATNPIKRSETAAIINRVALPENRKEGKLLEYGNRDQAVFLIDDNSFGRAPHSGIVFGSGWIVEDLSNASFNEVGSISPVLTDDSDKRVLYAHRDVQVQTRGVVVTELNYSTSGSGARYMFKDTEGNAFAEFVHKNGKLFFVGDKEYDTGVVHNGGQILIYSELDLDNGLMLLAVNGKEVATYPVKTTKAKNLATLTAGTTLEEVGTLTMGFVHMYVNYDVYDVFRSNKNGSKPYGWEVEGNAVITPVESAYDVGGVTITDAGKITKKFDAVTDKFVYETFVLVPAGQKAYVALYNGADVAIKVEATADGKFVCGDKELRKFNNAVWQQVRVEADTNTDKALIKINGKDTQTVAFTANSVDSIVVAFEGKGEMLVDDVKLWNEFDFADYCPTPVPVTDDEWIVGMSVCSLWREGTHYGWYCIDGYEENEPVLGYYDEGLKEVADWEIKFLVEHGYDFQHYCWYLGTQGKTPIKNTRLSAAIVDGYFNAEYSDMMDMMIMWENAGCNFKSPEFFYDNVWPYWCEWYFSDSRYLRVDNKAPLTIYRYGKFVENMGGEEGAKKAIEFMREDIKKLGYDDMLIFFSDRGANAETNKKMLAVGADALVSYTFGEASFDTDYQIKCMEDAYAAGSLALVPCIGVGFNDIGWTEIRTPYATAEAHQAVMEWAKKEYLPKISAREGEEWLSKFVFHTTWNEYGEGHYIMPSNLNKFGYVDANRAVFSSVAGKDDSKHFDIEPTDNQKARLGYMYAGTHTSMRKAGFVSSESSIANNEPVYVFNFENKDECSLWNTMMNTTHPVYDSNLKALVSETTTNDGALKNAIFESIAIDASEAKYLRIIMKLEGLNAGSGNFYFKHDDDSDWTAAKGYNFNYIGNGDDFSEVIIDLSKNQYWNGKVKQFRFDPCNVPAKFAVKSIEFLSNKSKDSFTIDIDSYKLVLPKEEVTYVGDEVFVAGNPSTGFYSLQNMYHKWNRKTGKLIVKASTGTEFEFNVGSDVALVDGAEKKLAGKIEVFDGLVKVPLMFIYENAGLEYTRVDGGVEVIIRDKSIKEALTTRVENQWEFNVTGDTESWDVSCAKGGVIDGTIFMTATPVTSTSTGFDPQITNKSVNFKAEYYKKCQVRLRPSYENEENRDYIVTMYFATSEEAGLSESKTVRADLTKLTPDAEGFYNIELDMSANAKWTGSINTIRLDPTNNAGYYEIDYIRMIVDPEMVEKAEAEAKEKAEQQMLLEQVDEGKPFYIKNADCESITGTFNARSSNGEVTIVEDDSKEGNHAFLVKADSSIAKKSWTYFIVPTRFKPGVTYKIDLDVKAVSDQNGNPVQNAVMVVNLRYTDKDANGNFKTMMDHALNANQAKSSTGGEWVHISTEHRISDAATDRGNDYFTVFANPQGDDANPINITYMVDNIVITVVE